MSALRLVKREFGPRFWFSLVRLDDDRVAMGGLKSEGEAEAWAMEAGHTLLDAPAKKSTAAPNLPGTGSISAAVDPPSEGAERAGARPALSDPSSEGVRPPRPRPMARPALSGRPLKDEAACCLATRDEFGRLCIGFCGPDCSRRRAS